MVATAAAQTVNFFVQKNLVFKSNAAFEKAVPKYIVLAVVLVLVSAALPAYSQSFFVNIGISEALAPTLANVLNILVQVVLSYPTMKCWIIPIIKRLLFFTRIALQSGFFNARACLSSPIF